MRRMVLHRVRPSLRERAAKGDPDAQFTLAKNYEAGRGGLKKDYRKRSTGIGHRPNRAILSRRPVLRCCIALVRASRRITFRPTCGFSFPWINSQGRTGIPLSSWRRGGGAYDSSADCRTRGRLAHDWKPGKKSAVMRRFGIIWALGFALATVSCRRKNERPMGAAVPIATPLGLAAGSRSRG